VLAKFDGEFGNGRIDTVTLASPEQIELRTFTAKARL
jgi:hypothetical protein